MRGEWILGRLAAAMSGGTSGWASLFDLLNQVHLAIYAELYQKQAHDVADKSISNHAREFG